MEASSITLLSAFAGGVISFLAPCVLPLIPGYLSFMTGLSNAELSEGRAGISRVMVPAVLFTAGFSSVFVLIGAATGLASHTLGSTLSRYDQALQYAAGVAVILIGVFILGVFKVPWLYGEARFEMGRARRFGKGAAFIMGLAFGFGWTPCVGPILTVILGFAAQTGDTLRAAVLLAAYSAGLAVPFLLTALFFSKLTSTLRWFMRYSVAINRTAGVVLIIMGVLIFTGQLGRLSMLLMDVFPSLRVLG